MSDRVGDIRERVEEFEKRLRGILDAREDAEREVSARKGTNEEEFKRAAGRLRDDLETRKKELEARRQKAREAVAEAATRRTARAARALESATAKVKAVLAKSTEKVKAEHQRVRDQSVGALMETQAKKTRRLTSLGSEIASLKKDVEAWRGEVEAFGATVRARAREEVLGRGDFANVTPETVVPALRDALDQDAALLSVRGDRLGMKLVRSLSWPTLLFMLAVLHGGAFGAAWLVRKDLVPMATFAVPLSFLTFLAVGGAAIQGLRSGAREFVNGLRARTEDMRAALKRCETGFGEQMSAGKDRQLEEKINVLAELDDRFTEQEREAKDSAAGKMEKLKGRHERISEKIVRRKNTKLQDVEARFAGEAKALDDSGRRQADERRTGLLRSAEEADSQGKGAHAKLASEWSSAVGDFSRAADDARRRTREAFPAWGDARWKSFRMSDGFPPSVYLGEARIDFSAVKGRGEFSIPGNGSLALPMSLAFPEQGGLLVSSDAAGRASGLEVLFNTVLRILSSFPPGKAKFLFIDPVGLGQSFSALMHLADFDESLVGGRIWTEASHIEKKLAELTEHIEKVIQKYLRNRYASIDEYNRDVGIMAEAYRFLVIADLPAGFSDIALERLGAIISSGARCGVHVLMHHDARERLPGVIDLARFRKQGLVVKTSDGKFSVDEEALPRAALDVESPPPAEALTSLLHEIGRQCQAAAKVEVPFEMVMPEEGKWATGSTEGGVKFPLGRAGADRLQSLELGKGTAQHALIAGKTGSGKSTLFHVMITNSSLWFSPRELELYLIDFKKGVEFKRFATHELPHARVVAIESDREFGVSVLRRIDKELAARAELFRAAGVQDFAGYRKHGKDRYLPRTLLLIDEFQEFFTEEDAIGQEAALLLDRIVRQGRAFGVHVILGSQTLGGSYTLAKATLGQMGVRIALACNEADSYMILGDDNAAARLLSRPGEAIYNDQSGRVEGNNPFQIVWLNDETEEKYLARIHELALKNSWTPPEPMMVFEGNVPADIRNNPLLTAALAKPFAAEEPPRAWVGEANAIKGPTEVRFKKQGGANFLVVGQARESALSVVESSIASLASQLPPNGARFILFDGSPPELEDGKRLASLAAALPHGVERVEYAKVPEVMEALDAEVKARLDGGGDGRRTFLVIYDLQRFRKLRAGDEYAFGDDAAKTTPDKALANVLTEGPSQGVHVICWCDSLANLKRTFNQKTQREFEIRVLFQMSAADSSELIDMPAAGKLGLHRGLLFLEEEGTVEKFRPYAGFADEWLAQASRALKNR